MGILAGYDTMTPSMARAKTTWRGALLVFFASLPAHADDRQFWPEVDVYTRLNSLIRLYVEAKEDRDGGASQQVSAGPSIQFYLKPLLRLKDVTAFDLDEAKARFLVVETGYRTIAAPNAPVEQRWELITTLNFPLRAGFLFSDRNRADLDWQSGKFQWRYRNRVTVERNVAIRSYHFTPYVAVEPYYVSQFNTWSTTEFYAGGLFPVNRHIQFDSYYENENNTGKRPNKPKYGMGVALHLFFPAKKD